MAHDSDNWFSVITCDVDSPRDFVTRESTHIDCTNLYEVLSCGIQCERDGSVSSDHILRDVSKDEVISNGHSSIIQRWVPV